MLILHDICVRCTWYGVHSFFHFWEFSTQADRLGLKARPIKAREAKTILVLSVQADQ